MSEAGSQGMKGESDGGSERRGERWKRRQWGGVGVGAGGERLLGGGINLRHLELLMGVGLEEHGNNLVGTLGGTPFSLCPCGS